MTTEKDWLLGGVRTRVRGRTGARNKRGVAKKKEKKETGSGAVKKKVEACKDKLDTPLKKSRGRTGREKREVFGRTKSGSSNVGAPQGQGGGKRGN